MNRLDRLIAYVAPQMAARRELARYALTKMSGYKDASPSRIDAQTVSRGTAADWNLELGYDRRRMVDRAIQLEQDNLIAGSLLDRSTENVIGEGFRLRMKSEDDGWNLEAEEFFHEWADHHCDVRQTMTFNEILQMTHRSMMRDGDVGWILNADGTIRPFESSELASPQGGYSRPNMADGVELDKHGAPVAYHIFDPDPNVLWADRRQALSRLTRVPAENVIFFARHTRFGQTRGLTAFQGLFWILEQLDGTLEAVTVAHRMAALFGLVVKKKSPFSGFAMGQDAAGTARPQIAMEPGGVMRLEPDEDVTQISPAHPGAQTEGHIKNLVRIAGSRFATPMEVVLGDYSASNYSNTRTSILSMSKPRKMRQHYIGHRASDVVRWRLINFLDGSGTSKRVREKIRRDVLRHLWLFTGQPWVDPVAEVQSDQAALDGGFTTKRAVLAKLGYDYDEIQTERELEQADDETRGLRPVRSTLTREPAPTVEQQTELAAAKPQPPAKGKPGQKEKKPGA